MSEPKRYTLALPDISYGMDESNKGEYVLWMDYARLKAEVDNSNRINTELLLLSNKQASEVRRLTAELSNISGWGRGLESDLSHARVEISFLKAEVERLNDLCKKLSAQHSDISCENIMLRKAGDAMERSLSFEYPDSPKVKDWNAAKEGKHTK